MKDLMGMMKKAQEMQARMGEMQAALEHAEIDGTAGAGMVTVTLSGKGAMKGVNIDPSLLVEKDAGILEDLLIAAHDDARSKVDALNHEKMQEMTAGIPIPPGMKLPF